MPTLTQAMLDGAVDVPLVLASGVWSFAATLTVPSGARISGPGAVLQPSLTWAAPTTPALHVINASDIVIEDIEIDGRGDERIGTYTVAQLLRIEASSDIELTGMTFRDGGVNDGEPSGPLLAIVARDVSTDILGAGVGMAVGSSENISVTNCTFVQSAGAVVAFGARVLTDWGTERDPDDFTHHCKTIWFEGCTFDGRNGEMYWNQLEFAGGGTRDVFVTDCTFRGKCLSAIDFDKGCHHGEAWDCTITDGGKPTREVGDVTTRLVVIDVHGSSSTYRTTDIHVHDCTLARFSSTSSDVYESMLGTQNATRVLFEDIEMEDLNDSLVGYGVVVDANSTDVAFRRITMGDVYGGFSTNLGAKGYDDIAIDDCVIEAVTAPIVLGAGDGAASDSQPRLTIRNTRATRTTDAAGYIINITSVWSDALLDGNEWLGNGGQLITPGSVRAASPTSSGPFSISDEGPTAPETGTRYGAAPFFLVRPR